MAHVRSLARLVSALGFCRLRLRGSGRFGARARGVYEP